MFKITLETGPGAGQIFLSPRTLEEGTAFKVGRKEGADIVLDSSDVSSNHGEFVYHGSSLYYRDLRSTNGSVLLRGDERHPLDEEHGFSVELSDGDKLLVGHHDNAPRLLIELLGGPNSDSSDEGGRREPTIVTWRGLDTVMELQGRVARDPTRATRIYRASQLISASLNLRVACESACAAIFDLLPNATNISLLLDQAPVAAGEAQEAASTAPDFVPFMSLDREGQSASGDRPSRKVVAQILERMAAVIMCDTSDFDPSQSILRAHIRSMIAVPLAVGDRTTGILQVDNRAQSGTFTQDDLEATVVLVRQLALVIENARLFGRVVVAEERLARENRFLKRREARLSSQIIGDSPAMKEVFGLVDKVVDTKATILITGETGTGKELIAQALHYRSRRADKLFVAQNCSALPLNLLESELFGHKKGAFTGADSDKKGLFEIAHQGTIFLDEIGETAPELQAKLLRVLQEGEIRPVAAMYPKRIDVRVVAATNRNLEQEVAAGRFREDLYYRLAVFPITLPALRDRLEDVPVLAEHFLAKFSREYGRDAVHFSPEAILVLKSYPWPGNIRELENEVQRLVIYGVPGELILPEHLGTRIRRAQTLVEKVGAAKGGLKQMMEEVERWMILDALREHGNNKTKTAESLKITREGLHKKLNRFGL